MTGLWVVLEVWSVQSKEKWYPPLWCSVEQRRRCGWHLQRWPWMRWGSQWFRARDTPLFEHHISVFSFTVIFYTRIMFLYQNHPMSVYLWFILILTSAFTLPYHVASKKKKKLLFTFALSLILLTLTLPSQSEVWIRIHFTACCTCITWCMWQRKIWIWIRWFGCKVTANASISWAEISFTVACPGLQHLFLTTTLFDASFCLLCLLVL